MLKTRPITLKDIEKVRKLHDLHFSELDFPDFGRLLNAFVIEDEENDIVMAGGVEIVGEALLISNKDKNRIKLGKSLVIAQGACAYICNRMNIRYLHAFTNNPDFAKHLEQHGFETRAQALRMRIPNGWQINE